ncbi:MAG: hypothetical protein Q8P24_18580 [Desulfobacterales bacterium]|nr:hypothetical protein [Desulfobacterales bacterium]
MSLKTKAFILIAGCVFIFSCGPKPLAPKAALDTPSHHVSSGVKLLNANKIEAAFREFDRARELDPKYSPAYVGLGLVHGIRSDYKNGLGQLKKAEQYAQDKAQESAVYVGYMRLYIMGNQKIGGDWLEQVKSHFDKAILATPDLAGPYYYMGMAHKEALQFSDAKNQFRKVIDLNRDHVAAADQEWKMIQKIERAMPGSEIGKKIALMAEITRADVAALFIEELKVDQLFSAKRPAKFNTSFQSPEKSLMPQAQEKNPPVTDAADHVLSADIHAALEIGIKGLEAFPDHTFKPDQMITRAGFAMMIEDIIIKTTGDEKLATKFIGGSSPFPDLRNDLPYFNAAVLCVTRGIMEIKDFKTGEFDAAGPVSGADALLSIRTLKNQL